MNGFVEKNDEQVEIKPLDKVNDNMNSDVVSSVTVDSSLSDGQNNTENLFE